MFSPYVMYFGLIKIDTTQSSPYMPTAKDLYYLSRTNLNPDSYLLLGAYIVSETNSNVLFMNKGSNNIYLVTLDFVTL